MTLSLFVAAASFMDSSIHIPRSAPPIFCVLLFVSIGSLQMMARAYYQRVVGDPNLRENILIYGAGAAGTQLAATIQTSAVNSQSPIENVLIDFIGLWFGLSEQANGGHDAPD